MSNLSNAQILQIIASLRTLTNTLEASLGPLKAEAAADSKPVERKQRSDKGKSRSKKPAAGEEPPEEAEPKGKKEPKARKPKPKARKPSAWQDFVKQEGGIKKASQTKTTHPMAYQEFVEAWNEEHGVAAVASAAPVKKAPATATPPKPKAKKELPPLPASEDEGEAEEYEMINIDDTNYWLDADMGILYQDNGGEAGDFAHFYKDGEIVNHL
jgi:hypothetical protein